MGVLLVVALLATVEDVMVIVGGRLSKVQINVFEAVLLFPTKSVNLFALTLIVHRP